MESCTRLTRLALSLAALMCVAGSARAFPADNVPYCSSGFETPATIVFNSGRMTVTVGGKTTEFVAHEPLDGVDGIIFYGEEFGETGERVKSDVYAVKVGKDEVILFEDRVFWPCSE